mgnify:CR=1 FL=1|jgi:hypothetical protein
MNIHEMYAKVREIYEAHKDDYYLIGIRFENKDRVIGEECEWSKDNPDREDEREFPKYGTPEYEELPELDGTSAWDLSLLSDRYYPGFGEARWITDPDKECSRYFLADHCYIVAGDKRGRHDCPDDGEILIRDAVVIAKLW